MKKITLAFIIILFANNLFAQSWQHLTTGVSGQSSPTASGEVNAFTVFNNKLIVGGGFSSAGGNFASAVAAWDGVNWSTLNTGIQGGVGAFAGVQALIVYNNELIAAGSFSAANTTTLGNLAKWDGVNWQNIPNPMFGSVSAYNGIIKALAVYNSKLIAAGTFTASGAMQNIAQWDGLSWAPLGTGLSGSNGLGGGFFIVESMVVFNGELYAAGTFTNAGGVAVSNIAKWNGTTWSTVGTGIPSCLAGKIVPSLCVYNNELYAANCTSGISKWNGTSWVTVGGGIIGLGTIGVCSMAVYDNKLIVGGLFNSVAGNLFLNIAAWDGLTWTYVGGDPLYAASGNNGLNDAVSALLVYNGCLYAGGGFTESMDVPQVLNLNFIAKYCGTVGIEEYNKNSNITVYPNPSTSQFNFNGLVGENTIQITDITGRALLTEKTFTENHTIKLNAAQGIYFYKIAGKQNRVQQGKLVIQ
jgi:hypothetical protein